MKNQLQLSLLALILFFTCAVYSQQSATMVTVVGDVKISKALSIVATKGKLFSVDWGDGKKSTEVGTGSYQFVSHSYVKTGQYTIVFTAEVDCQVTNFSCSQDNIISLNVDNMGALKYLSCRLNQLETINVDKLTELNQLYCNGNKLTYLDIQKLTKLKELECFENQLSFIELKKISDHLSGLSKPVVGRLGTQLLAPRIDPINHFVDYTSMAFIEGIPSVFKVIKNGKNEAVLNRDYKNKGGIIAFLKEAEYCVEISNSLIKSDPGYPVKIVQDVSVIETDLMASMNVVVDTSQKMKTLKILSTAGKLISINWGDDSYTVEVPRIDQELIYSHEYKVNGAYNINIETEYACDITRLFCNGNQINELTIDELTMLSVFDCQDNFLTLDKLNELSIHLSGLTSPIIGSLGVQTLGVQNLPLSDEISAVVDYSNLITLGINNFFTQFVVKKNGNTAVENTDYRIAEGKIRFFNSGEFTIEMTNEAIQSVSIAKVIDKVIVTGSTTSLRETNNGRVHIYPNPSTDIVCIKGIVDSVDAILFNSIGVAVMLVNTTEFDISCLDSGIYFLKINENVIRIIKK